MLRYHDYHLKGYRVDDFGNTITLDLIFDYPERKVDSSMIQFTDVVLYHFVHSSGAIITDIESTPVSKVIADHSKEITEWANQLGVAKWTASVQGYAECLESEGYLSWYIESAIGFHGFVIAKAIVQMPKAP